MKHAAVMVAIPAVEWMYTQAARAQRRLQLPPGSALAYETKVSSIAAKRLALAELFLKHEQFSHPTVPRLGSGAAPGYS